MTTGQIYLLGALAMGLRTLWATRPQRDPATGEPVQHTLLVFDDGREHDIRYLLAALFAVSWPILILVWIYAKIVMRVKDAGDDDDLRAE